MTQHYHYSQSSIDKAVESMIARLRANASPDPAGQLRMRIFEQLAPALMRCQVNELNNGADPASQIAGTMEVFGWWISNLTRNSLADSDSQRFEFIAGLAGEVARHAVSKLDAVKIGEVHGDAGGRA